jgi:hypothetical protein
MTADEPIATPSASGRTIPVTAWVALGLFYLAVNAVNAICWLAEMELAAGANLLLGGASVVVTWNWLEQECRPYRQTYPMDMGMFIYALGVLLIPYYMWRNQRWLGILKVGIVIGMWLMAYVFTVGTAWIAASVLG